MRIIIFVVVVLFFLKTSQGKNTPRGYVSAAKD